MTEVTVTQADRGLAAYLTGDQALFYGMAGLSDAVQECARHREEAVSALKADNERLREANDRLQDALRDIQQWSEAYPLRAFPEPDFEVCAKALKAAGQTLDAVSASSMRHVVEGVGKIARTILAETKGEGL